MDKRRHAQKLIAYLRWIVMIPGLAATSCAPQAQLAAILGAVAVCNGVLCYYLGDLSKFARGGRRMALICRALDALFITYFIAAAGSHGSSAYLLYWFILVGLGYAGVGMRGMIVAASAITVADAAATFYALALTDGTGNVLGHIAFRSALIVAGLLISIYIGKSRSREDQALERGWHLQAILNTGARLADFKNVHELAYYVLETAVNEANGVGGKLLLVNDATGDLECEAFYSTDGPASENAPSEARLRAYSKWVMSSGREFMVGAGTQGEDAAEEGRDDKPAIAAPLLGQSSNSDGSPAVLGILIIWGRAGEALGDDAMDMLRIFSAIAGAALVNLRLYTNLQKSFLNTIQSLAKGLEARDEYTCGHSERVMQVACAIAEELDVPPDRIDMLRNASLLHDIGKIGVPDAILGKAGKLTAEEWETMRRHAIVSGEICRPLGLAEEVLFLIAHHHERLDGKGYPSGLSAQELPFLQRILVVSDTFDAMRSRRPYRDVIPEEQLIAEFNKCAGRTLDPTVVDTLKQLLLRRELDPIYAEHDRITSVYPISTLDEDQKAA